MIAAIMQPYLFPYIGYFQLLRQSDVFVLYDDVQYIKGGWVNRNRILVNGTSAMITFPIQTGSHRLHINQRRYQLDTDTIERLLRRLEAAYRKAPHFNGTFSLVRDILRFGEHNVAAFNAHAIRRIASYLEIRTRILTSSELQPAGSIHGQGRVIGLCEALGATDYINPIGGLDLYRHDDFARQGIALRFLEARSVPYVQHGNDFVPFLSIIDVLMFNDPGEIVRLLEGFNLHAAAGATRAT